MPAQPLDIQLLGIPLWLVAAPIQGGAVWLAALEDGQVQAFRIEDREVIEITLDASMLPPGMPPALRVAGDHLDLISPFPDSSPFTNPLLLDEHTQAYIDRGGQLHLIRQDASSTLAVGALPDARILSDGAGRLLLLTAPTDQYPHGVLGDNLEATAITLLDTKSGLRVVNEIHIDAGDVIEGIAPIWVDLDGDGAREIIVTQSNADAGARIVVYREDGGIVASGEPVGQGFRWRHQLAAGQFIDGGPLEIAVIRTPHIGGILEIFALEDGRLEIKAELSGFSSHQIGSRNLDSALVADFSGDGILEVVVPDQSQTSLAGIQYTQAGLQIVWDVPLGAQLSANLAAVSLSDGRLALGVGLVDGRLRISVPYLEVGFNISIVFLPLETGAT